MTARNDNPLTTWLRAKNRTAWAMRANRENSLENESLARHQRLLRRSVADTSPRWISPLADSY